MGPPWWSSGYNSAHPMQGTWVQSLVETLRSHVAWSKNIFLIKNKSKKAELIKTVECWLPKPEGKLREMGRRSKVTNFQL